MRGYIHFILGVNKFKRQSYSKYNHTYIEISVTRLWTSINTHAHATSISSTWFLFWNSGFNWRLFWPSPRSRGSFFYNHFFILTSLFVVTSLLAFWASHCHSVLTNSITLTSPIWFFVPFLSSEPFESIRESPIFWRKDRWHCTNRQYGLSI